MENIEWQKSVRWYTSHFPESQFLVAEQHKHEYNKRTILGHHIAQKSDVLICGIMRNVGTVFPYTRARIEALGRLFNSYHVYMYENDSKDHTKENLVEWSNSNRRVEYYSEDVSPPPFYDLKGRDRRIWMAYARNKYLAYARRFAQQQRIHYLIIVDTDLQGGWSYHGVLNSLGHSGWDCMGSNSLYYLTEKDRTVRLFYDAWAFRGLGQPEEIPDTTANLFQFHRGEPIIQVNSSFGGLGIYKPHILYKGVDYTEDDCDHPTLHNALVEKECDIYLNPSQITLYNQTEYTI